MRSSSTVLAFTAATTRQTRITPYSERSRNADCRSTSAGDPDLFASAPALDQCHHHVARKTIVAAAKAGRERLAHAHSPIKWPVASHLIGEWAWASLSLPAFA